MHICHWFSVHNHYMINWYYIKSVYWYTNVFVVSRHCQICDKLQFCITSVTLQKPMSKSNLYQMIKFHQNSTVWLLLYWSFFKKHWSMCRRWDSRTPFRVVTMFSKYFIMYVITWYPEHIVLITMIWWFKGLICMVYRMMSPCNT